MLLIMMEVSSILFALFSTISLTFLPPILAQTERNKAQLVGAHDSWWNDGDGCRFENKWNVWTCNFDSNTAKPRFVATLRIYDHGVAFSLMNKIPMNIVTAAFTIITLNVPLDTLVLIIVFLDLQGSSGYQ